MLQLSRRTFGILEIIASGITFGFLGLFGKAAYQAGLSPGELLSFRFLFASILLGVFLAFKNPKLLKVPKEVLIKSLCLGIFGYAIFSSCYFQALKGLSASLTVLLLYLYPVMVSLGALYLFKEKMSPAAWVALPITCAGMALLVWGDMNVQQPISLLFGVGSAVFYSIYILASRKWLSGVAPLSSSLYIQIGTAVALILFNFHFNLEGIQRSQEIIANAWHILIGISLLSTILPMLLFLSGLKKLTSSETSILSTTEPLTAIFVAGLFLGEQLTSVQYLGAVFVIAALILTSLPKMDIIHEK